MSDTNHGGWLTQLQAQEPVDVTVVINIGLRILISVSVSKLITERE